MKKGNFLKMLIALPVVFAATACNNGAKESKTAVEETEKVSVKVKQCFEREVEQIEVFTATVEANVVNNISPNLTLRIEKLYAEVGDHVRKGQKLADLDASNLVQAKLQMLNDSLEFVRNDILYKVGVISKSEWDAKKLSYDISSTSYRNLLENTVLTSPVSGVVTARNYDRGDMFSMGQPLYVVEEITPVKIMVNASEQLFSHIKKGDKVDVTLDVYGDEVFSGVVSLVYPTVDPQTRTFPVEIKIANANERVRPGMFARVKFTYGTATHVVVPDMAVVKLTGSGDRFVYVVGADNKVTFKKVELGRRFDTEYEIVSGLNSGDNVVVEGQNRVTNGMEVVVVE